MLYIETFRNDISCIVMDSILTFLHRLNWEKWTPGRGTQTLGKMSLMLPGRQRRCSGNMSGMHVIIYAVDRELWVHSVASRWHCMPLLQHRNKEEAPS